MKSLPFVILLFSVAFLTGCLKHQYFSVSSDLPRQSDGSFKYEDDTLKVLYSFSRDGTINIEITNKLDELIFIDWEKSAMIFDSEGYTFSNGKASFEGSSASYNLNDDFQVGNFSGTLASSPNRRYIPPQSRVSHQFTDMPIGYNDLKATEYDKVMLPGGIVGKKYAFDKDDPANTYQSYLYLSALNSTESHILKHDFWLDGLVETLHGVQHLSSDQFERSEPTSVGLILGTAGLVGVIYIAAQAGEEAAEQ